MFTLRAWGPLGLSSVSYSTFAPSARVLKPSDWIALKWTKTSLPPSVGVMKPKPFASLNHFTVPVAMQKHLLLPKSRTGRGWRGSAQPLLAHLRREHSTASALAAL